MKEWFETLWGFATAAIALAIAGLIIGYAIRLHARMWRTVAEHFARRGATPHRTRRFETIVIAERGLTKPFSLGSYRQYAGTWVSVHNDGLALSLVPPFSLACPPLFLRFEDMTLQRTDWALWSEPFAIRMTVPPHIDIVLAQDTVRWIRQQTDRAPFGWGD